MHGPRKTLSTEVTDRWWGSGVGLLVERHSEVQRPLKDVEELPEWQVEQHGDTRSPVDQGEHHVTLTVQSVHAYSQHQASRRHCQEQEQRYQVVAELLHGHDSSLFETPMQRQPHTDNDQDRRQVQEIEEHIA